MVGDISRRQANTREISDIFHFTAIHFLPERHSAMVLIGERAKRARHSQVCSIENRIYIIIIIMVRANFVLITRKEGGA